MSISKEQQLWDASSKGNLDLVVQLAKDPFVNVNWIGPDRNDLLIHRACRFGHVEVVEILLQHPAVDVNAANAGKATLLYIACQEGHVAVVSLLLKDPRIDVNQPDHEDVTPFYMACQNEHRDVVSLHADPRIDPTLQRKGEPLLSSLRVKKAS